MPANRRIRSAIFNVATLVAIIAGAVAAIVLTAESGRQVVQWADAAAVGADSGYRGDMAHTDLVDLVASRRD